MMILNAQFCYCKTMKQSILTHNLSIIYISPLPLALVVSVDVLDQEATHVAQTFLHALFLVGVQELVLEGLHAALEAFAGEVELEGIGLGGRGGGRGLHYI